ncbi:MAG: carbonic anhydrase family protein [Pseudomonadota bacterium]|nr:carbonic anhydrase family protein [Pseudomonadota bacterium]
MNLLNRRMALKTALVASTAAMASTAFAQQSCAVLTGETQAGITPDGAIKLLQDGNARFVAGQSINCDLLQQVRDTSKGQAPFAAVVGCIDSRVPPELVFDQRIGDIFAARVAGNYVNDDIIGSLEFATQLAGSKAIVVLGHSECGAVKGAVDDAKLGLLTGVLAQIRPSLAKLNYEGVPSSKDKALVQRVAEQNVRDAVAKLTARSEVLAKRVQAGQLKIVGAMHDISTGKIQWMA